VSRPLEPLLSLYSTAVITDRMSLDETPEGYKRLDTRKDGIIKIVLKP